MALYRAIVKCFVGNALRKEDEVFEYNGPKNTNLALVDGPAEDPEVQAETIEAAPEPAKKWKPKAQRVSKASADKASA